MAKRMERVHVNEKLTSLVSQNQAVGGAKSSL